MAANRFIDPENSGRDIDPSCGEREQRRYSRWMSVLYVVVALVAPLAIFSGPDILSPTEPAIVNAAVNGRFAIDRHRACGDPPTEAAPRVPMRKAC